jgi:hypothetical protein
LAAFSQTYTKAHHHQQQFAQMVAIKSLLAATLALLSSQAEATRLFYNSGTLDGWDYIRREHKGTVDQVTNVQYKSGTALKMTQTYDPNYSGRYHSEVDHNDGYNRGDERFYGFMFRVSDKWEFVSQSHNIAQFISHRTGSDNCGDDYMPSTMVWISGNKLQTRLVNGPYIGGNCHRDFVGFSDVATIQPGQWHKVIIQARWEDNDTGYFKMWFDGQKVVERYNVATTVSGNWPFQFRGMYSVTCVCLSLLFSLLPVSHVCYNGHHYHHRNPLLHFQTTPPHQPLHHLHQFTSLKYAKLTISWLAYTPMGGTMVATWKAISHSDKFGMMRFLWEQLTRTSTPTRTELLGQTPYHARAFLKRDVYRNSEKYNINFATKPYPIRRQFTMHIFHKTFACSQIFTMTQQDQQGK